MAEAPWLSILGVGDDGADGLTPAQRRALDGARMVVGSRRVLDRLTLGESQVTDWSAGVQATIGQILARRGEPVCVLATGDPMHYGIGATLLAHVAADEMRVLPSPSAFSLAAARLGWPLQDAAHISLHGRAVERLAAHLSEGRRILALTSAGGTAGEAARILCEAGYGASRLTVLEHMGGPQERMVETTAEMIGDERFADFNTLAIECWANVRPIVDGTGPGLPDDAYRHDGQLTKREVRAVVLAHLRPAAGRLLWDVGAGCGSVAIEWMRAAEGARAVAIERDAGRLAMLRENAARLGAPDIAAIQGEAPDVLSGLDAPHAVFIGGGLSGAGVFEVCWTALRPGGRLVATAVTLESEARMLALHADHGGELVRIAVSRAEPVGRFSGWKPFMPVTLFSLEKPR
ncbi:precorrin-6y C5,15-methyltransferase (decarboxylating) subunit CbiE [Pararhizobium haloflavum]|uniref:precorrin-6y C5,15-methyltransferase (decarboxylating) subunit CbiE n=1 Tax=Pararhizobium haloflavum TaxID=2037914 RepID=UPI000C17D16D|nr:precorrin-6y C5,15-methyltransferase (decarboxylating) subunit CbiE [Pararhizobium haloflavum]